MVVAILLNGGHVNIVDVDKGLLRGTNKQKMSSTVTVTVTVTATATTTEALYSTMEATTR